MTRRALVALLAVALVGCTGRPRTGVFQDGEEDPPGGPRVIELGFTDPIPESTDAGGLFRLPVERTFSGLVRMLERARADDDVKGAFVRFGTADFSFTQAEELGLELRHFILENKPVVCHADSLGNASSWLAHHGCSQIWLSPAGDADTVGIAAQLVYIKNLLDRLGVDADFLSVGRYKSFAESITRDGPSEAAREALSAMLESLRQTWLEDVAAVRPKPALGDRLEHGPWTAKEAEAHGLVDALGFESDAREDAKHRAGAPRVEHGFGRKEGAHDKVGVAEILRILSGAHDRQGDTPRVAVVPAIGGISMRSSEGFGGDEGITFVALSRTLKRLAKDDAVKAVVVRIDSPGGSALASDLIWHELMLLRQAKPVVASVGEMAASGGYYIASAAHRIVAPRTSIVGSIGVVGGKVVFGDALKELGVTSVTVPASDEAGAEARAAYMSLLTAWDDATRERVRVQMNRIYELFVERVAEARSLEADKVKASAEGRIWSGAQALERGLIDELGGLGRALEIAREKAGLERDAPVVVEGVRETLLEALLLDDAADEVTVERALLRWQAARTGLLALVPRDWIPLASAAAPLAQGEHVLAAMPLLVHVR